MPAAFAARPVRHDAGSPRRLAHARQPLALSASAAVAALLKSVAVDVHASGGDGKSLLSQVLARSRLFTLGGRIELRRQFPRVGGLSSGLASVHLRQR